MEATVGYEKKVKKTKQTQPRLTLTFKQWVLKTVKGHKKRTSMDSRMGIIITVFLFLIALV
jgi:hypothetical protein